MRIPSYLLLFLLTCSCVTMQAQDTKGGSFVTVSGEVTKPLTLTPAVLDTMKKVNAVLKDRDGKEHTYRGVTIGDILRAAGVTTNGALRGEHLSKYLLVQCADGYQVLFSLAELDADFTDRVVILANELEGKPLPAGKGPFRLIVPGEHRPARSCHQVVALRIGYAKE